MNTEKKRDEPSVIQWVVTEPHTVRSRRPKTIRISWCSVDSLFNIAVAAAELQTLD